jgi:ribonuclease Z
MLQNLPYKSHTHHELTIEGYSRAAVQSYWRIPELKLGFDLGGQPWDFMGTPTWFVSHSHLDHIAALPVLVARRRMMKMAPPRIYLPSGAIGGVEAMLRSFSRLDRGRLPCELLPVEPGDTIELSRELAVSVHKTIHTIPSVGYVVWERRKKLKAEYRGFTGEQIRDLRQEGKEVSEETRKPKLAYLGDSRAEGLDENPDMLQAEVLILEMTFVAPDHRMDKIRKLGHIHLDDIVARRDKFENQLIIAGHFSTRYHPNQIQNTVRRAIPDMLGDRLKLWL